MLFKSFRLTIKFLISLISLGLLLVLIAYFINLNEGFTQLNAFLKTNSISLFFFRLLVYSLGFCFWPFLIRCSSTDQTDHQIKTMTSARNYLLGAILIQEILIWWR